MGNVNEVKPEEVQYVLYRIKSQSFFRNSVPHEYSASNIRMDMRKGGFMDLPSEVEIENFINWKKEQLSRRIIDFVNNGIPLSQIRTWCEYSLDCPVPIPSLNQVTAEGILSRFDYFNFVINKIARQEQLDILIRHRKEKGTDIDINLVMIEMENSGIYTLQDEITRTSFYTEGDLLRILMEEEEDALNSINNYIDEGLSRDEVIKRCLDENCHVFKANELPRIIDRRFASYRLSKIARRVREMETSEIWHLINVVETYQMYRITGEKPDLITEETENGSGALETLTLYESDKKPNKEDHLFQLSQMDVGELRQLAKILRAYLTWRGIFYFVKKKTRSSTPNELMLTIIEAFSKENGIDSILFRTFLY